MADAAAVAAVPEASGGRRGRSAKKLRLVKKKTVRRMLSKMGLKMRGGMSTGAPSGSLQPAPLAGGATGGRRRRHKRRSHRVGKFFGF